MNGGPTIPPMLPASEVPHEGEVLARQAIGDVIPALIQRGQCWHSLLGGLGKGNSNSARNDGCYGSRCDLFEVRRLMPMPMEEASSNNHSLSSSTLDVTTHFNGLPPFSIFEISRILSSSSTLL
jgi:hypothetical protein